MNWLLQNWIWVALGIGVAYFFFRGRLGGHGAGRGGLIGMGHGRDAAGGGHGGHGDRTDSRAAANVPEAAVDPVVGGAVRTAQALTSLYQGTIYYFASRENRDRFEAAPQEYVQKATGHSVVAAAPEHRPRRRRGC